MNSQNRSKMFLILMAMTMLMGMQAYAQTPKNELVINDFESRIDLCRPLERYGNAVEPFRPAFCQFQ